MKEMNNDCIKTAKNAEPAKENDSELHDNELQDVSGGGCTSSGAVVYDDSMCGKRAYHPTSGNTYTILGPCPDDPTKALVRNQYSGDEGYAPLAFLVIE